MSDDRSDDDSSRKNGRKSGRRIRGADQKRDYKNVVGKQAKLLTLGTENQARTENQVRLHFRRCHLCDSVTECEGALVERCAQCGKAMAPFFFFNEEDVALYSDAELRPQERHGDRNPVRGLTAYW